MQFDVDMKSEYKELFLSARKLLLSFDGMIETKKQRITTYSNSNGGICHMRTMPHGIDLGFLKGAIMEDQLDMLVGKGKIMRVLPLITLKEESVIYYVRQAISIIATP